MSIVERITNCPVEIAMSILGKKWTIHIIRDMFRGVTKFSDFLKLNEKLSTRVLSQRLRELTQNGLVERITLSQSPPHIEYHLTERGLGLQPVIIGLSKFSIIEYPEKVFATVVDNDEQSMAIVEAENRFSVISNIDDYSTVAAEN